MTNAIVAVKPLGRDNIRAATRSLRKLTEVDLHAYFCVVHWLETRFLPKVKFELDVRDITEMGENHGITDHNNNLIILREDVYRGAADGSGRDRMTVIHEAAHCLMHTPDRILFNRNFTQVPRYQDPEWQAKAFAGEFLVPAHLIKKGMDADDIANSFGVSQDAAAFQLSIYQKQGLII